MRETTRRPQHPRPLLPRRQWWPHRRRHRIHGRKEQHEPDPRPTAQLPSSPPCRSQLPPSPPAAAADARDDEATAASPPPPPPPPAAAAPTAGGGHGSVGTGSTPLPSSDSAPSSRPRSASPFRDRGEPRAAAMSKVFEGCKRQYCVAAASLSRKCTAASALDGG
ncbi:hypothetical protein PVAP13_8KG009202 [Panicum virgatum]|uniref:Uncharacterized protein n=1 Tax=Panicum virgatum TaxID=38727 RepID=A0A8T0PPC9_PANVG|nr:hypothetical protein PVAP13_8KG009202 [Panicum virgatum]